LESNSLESSTSVEWVVYLLFKLLTLDPTMSDSSAREEPERPARHQLLLPEVSLTSELHDDASSVRLARAPDENFRRMLPLHCENERCYLRTIHITQMYDLRASFLYIV